MFPILFVIIDFMPLESANSINLSVTIPSNIKCSELELSSRFFTNSFTGTFSTSFKLESYKCASRLPSNSPRIFFALVTSSTGISSTSE